MSRTAFVFAIALIAMKASAQTSASDSARAPAFEDNSFLVEEAYNQDAGVVQHITGLSIDHRTKSYEYDFTQEWPVGSIRHQLSYMIPLVHSGIPTSTTGIGDVIGNAGGVQFPVRPSGRSRNWIPVRHRTEPR
jgi:hypothetical protein